MGRPIKKKFFGNASAGQTGGEGVASVTLSTTSFAVSTLSVTVVFGAPQLPGGVNAAGTAVKTGNTVTSVTITQSGAGYLTAPSVSFTGTNMTSVGAATTVLTTTTQNAIKAYAYIPVAFGGLSGKIADIVKQEASKRYLVRTSDGIGQCRLTALSTASLTAGSMNIIAQDVLGSQYYVTKLTARRATLTTATNGGSGFEYADGAVTGWTLDSATTGTVTIANI